MHHTQSSEEEKLEEPADTTNMTFFNIFGKNDESEETQATERDQPIKIQNQQSPFGASKFQSKY